MTVRIVKKGEQIKVSSSDIPTAEEAIDGLQAFAKGSDALDNRARTNDSIFQGLEDIYSEIDVELERQYNKWGPQYHAPEMWITISLEEFGEAAQGVLRSHFRGEQQDFELAKKEIIETIACLIRTYDAVERRRP